MILTFIQRDQGQYIHVRHNRGDGNPFWEVIGVFPDMAGSFRVAYGCITQDEIRGCPETVVRKSDDLQVADFLCDRSEENAAIAFFNGNVARYFTGPACTRAAEARRAADKLIHRLEQKSLVTSDGAARVIRRLRKILGGEGVLDAALLLAEEELSHRQRPTVLTRSRLHKHAGIS